MVEAGMDEIKTSRKKFLFRFEMFCLEKIKIQLGKDEAAKLNNRVDEGCIGKGFNKNIKRIAVKTAKNDFATNNSVDSLKLKIKLFPS